jgi:hypothetical protein
MKTITVSLEHYHQPAIAVVNADFINDQMARKAIYDKMSPSMKKTVDKIGWGKDGVLSPSKSYHCEGGRGFLKQGYKLAFVSRSGKIFESVSE